MESFTMRTSAWNESSNINGGTRERQFGAPRGAALILCTCQRKGRRNNYYSDQTRQYQAKPEGRQASNYAFEHCPPRGCMRLTLFFSRVRLEEGSRPAASGRPSTAGREAAVRVFRGPLPQPRPRFRCSARLRAEAVGGTEYPPTLRGSADSRSGCAH